ncbi:MAG: queuosine precursor transporter [Chloroflexota bacterium]|nr:queuosine precursor transporter [Chloroflexota bacterium]
MPSSPRFLVVAGLFLTALITANITAVKLFQVASVSLPWGGQVLVVLPAGVLVFPLSYIVNDVLTEVYGYRSARAVIWLGFLCNGVAVLFIWLGGLLPPAPGWEGQEAYQRILGYTPRLVAASFAGYLVGELANARVLARLKVATRGRWLWFRTITSTLVGQGLDSLVFITIAFVGTVGAGLLVQIVITQWLAKSLYEALATPLTYLVVGYIKRREGVDTYDYGLTLNPLQVLRGGQKSPGSPTR